MNKFEILGRTIIWIMFLPVRFILGLFIVAISAFSTLVLVTASWRILKLYIWWELQSQVTSLEESKEKKDNEYK